MRDLKRLAGCDTRLRTRMAIYSAGLFRQGWATSANVTPQDALAITLRLWSIQCRPRDRRPRCKHACMVPLRSSRRAKTNSESTLMGIPSDGNQCIGVKMWHLLWSVISWHFYLCVVLCIVCSASMHLLLRVTSVEQSLFTYLICTQSHFYSVFRIAKCWWSIIFAMSISILVYRTTCTLQELIGRWDTRTWRDVSSYLFTYLPLNYDTLVLPGYFF